MNISRSAHDMDAQRSAFKETLEWTLLDAACQGDLGEIKKALKKGADINVAIPFDPPGLQRGEYQKGDTPILSAIRFDNYECARYLLAQGADINAQDRVGYTPLTLAVISCDIRNGDEPFELVRDLIARGAEVDKPDHNGNTPLHQAAWERNPEVTHLLLESGADLYRENKNSFSPCDCGKGYLDDYGDDLAYTVGVVLQGFHLTDEKERNTFFKNEFFKAVHNQNTECALYLAAKLPSINMLGDKGLTPLIAALHHDQFEVSKTLIAHGADVTLCDKRGRTPLLIATQKNDFNAVEALIQAGADIFDKGQTKTRTPYRAAKEFLKKSTNPSDDIHKIHALMEKVHLTSVIERNAPCNEPAAQLSL